MCKRAAPWIQGRVDSSIELLLSSSMCRRTTVPVEPFSGQHEHVAMFVARLCEGFHRDL